MDGPAPTDVPAPAPAPAPVGPGARLRLAGAALLLAALAGALDLRLLRSLELIARPRLFAPHDPGIRVAAAARPRDPAAPSRGVTLVLVDGLRQERARALPHLSGLAARGAWATVRALFPTFTRVGYATMTTGAPPRVHGYFSNANRRPARVPSIFDQARAAGVRTRSYYAGHGPPAPIFPAAFDAHLPLPPEGLPPSAEPHLTFVYIPEPDATAHRRGGRGADYDRASAWADEVVGRVAASLDLERETLVVATDHGHLDQGGHGGHEAIVCEVPLVLVGAGVKAGASYDLAPGGRFDLRDVGVTVAALLGIDPPPTASGAVLAMLLDAPSALRAAPPPAPGVPVEDDPRGPLPLAWALGAALLFGGLARVAAGAPGAPAARRAYAGAALAPLACAVGWALWGKPVSFSLVNADAEVVRVVLTAQALAGATALAGALASGARPAAQAGLALWAAAAGLAFGWAGFAAPRALAHPLAAFLAHLAAAHVLAYAALALVAAAWPPARRPSRPSRPSRAVA